MILTTNDRSLKVNTVMNYLAGIGIYRASESIPSAEIKNGIFTGELNPIMDSSNNIQYTHVTVEIPSDEEATVSIATEKRYKGKISPIYTNSNIESYRYEIEGQITVIHYKKTGTVLEKSTKIALAWGLNNECDQQSFVPLSCKDLEQNPSAFEIVESSMYYEVNEDTKLRDEVPILYQVIKDEKNKNLIKKPAS